MNCTLVENPRWANHDHNMIIAYVTFDTIGRILFVATPEDPMDYGRDIFQRCVIGDFGPVAECMEDPNYEPPVIVPKVVSRFQGRMALLEAGYLSAVESYFANTSDFEKEAWASITEMRRDSPMVANMGTLLGLSSTQIDELFIAASKIKA